MKLRIWPAAYLAGGVLAAVAFGVFAASVPDGLLGHTRGADKSRITDDGPLAAPYLTTGDRFRGRAAARRGGRPVTALPASEGSLTRSWLLLQQGNREEILRRLSPEKS